MVQIFTSVFQDEAIVVKSLLESAGLKPQVLVDGMLDVNPFFNVDVKGVRVYVSDAEAEDARAVVADFVANKGREE